ncbi:polysaccharide deacetylase family protein [Frankia sp. QA3]|uniref:polysaccharide deacetylase family protein n=1 Tax=Frankia sp. QA3 TaxID=710111 RepID=UPI000269BA38|nr:polysaccharide deacetylase family protein [Frankia sp. QA3]EIV90652.1 putative xylanase/chitin deacetylase [Frankia sp. QA3]
MSSGDRGRRSSGGELAAGVRTGADHPEPQVSRRGLFAWSASSAAGLILLTAVDPARASGESRTGRGAAGSATRPADGRSGTVHGSAGQAGGGTPPIAAVSTPAQPAYRIHDLRPDAPADAVALTIDDGPHPVWTPRILDILRVNQVSATFSLVGVQAVANPGLVRRIVAEGHSLCNHTMTHPQPFGRRTPEQIRGEMTRAQSAIVDAGAGPPRLFRAPGGDWSSAVLETAAGLGMTSLGWDVDPRDWARPGTASIRRSLGAARPGDILLCHDGGGNRAQTVAALQRVLPRLRARGLSFVPL